MLEIRQVTSYDNARYPSGEYVAAPDTWPWNRVRGALASSALVILLGACDETIGTTGPPPIVPDAMTENEAREVVNRVFADNGIVLDQDVMIRLEISPGDSADLELDGYDAGGRFGYEYIAGADSLDFTEAVRDAAGDASGSDGPYIKLIDPTYSEYAVENAVEEFIEDLRSMGII